MDSIDENKKDIKDRIKTSDLPKCAESSHFSAIA